MADEMTVCIDLDGDEFEVPTDSLKMRLEMANYYCYHTNKADMTYQVAVLSLERRPARLLGEKLEKKQA